VTSAGWASDGHNVVRFQATRQTTSRLVAAPTGRCTDPSTVAGLLEAVGPGDTNLLGVVTDEQSHCVRKDGTSFDGGKFTLTNPQGKKVEGRYFGTIVPTFNPGIVQIAGRVCIWRVGGRTVSDCKQPDDYDPAKGIVNFDSRVGGPATIFIDQVIRLK
jgi:hypothetical protein